MKNIEWIRINSAGNITALVITKVPRELYMEVATGLFSLPDQDFEQVGFIVDDTTLEMAGLEFCGNASRSFALWSAKKKGLQGQHNVTVKVSGADKPIEVFVNTYTNFTRASMPLPEQIETIPEGWVKGCPKMLRVDLGGITHFVVLDIPYSEALFKLIKDFGIQNFDPPALGVIFVDTKVNDMLPIVYVKEVDTIYHEGSCGSGTVAAIIALKDREDSQEETFHCELRQPRGKIGATLSRRDNIITKITIEGPVDIGQMQSSIINEFVATRELED